MSVRSDEFHRAAVEREPTVGVETERTHSERRDHLVGLAIDRQLCVDFVEMGILSIPQSHSVDFETLFGRLIFGIRREFEPFGRPGDDAPFAVCDSVLELHSLRLQARVGEHCSYSDLRMTVFHAFRPDVDALRRIVRGRNMRRRCVEQVDVTIDAAVERVVGREGRNVGVVRVVGAYLQQIVSGVYKLGHIERECRVTAGMRTGLHAVHVDLGMRIDRFEQ